MSIEKRAERIMICIANIYNTGGVIQNDDFNFIANQVEEIKKEIADVQPIVYAHKTINVGRRSYCSNCGELAIMENFCSKCGAKVEGGEQTRNLTDDETAIYESWIESEAKDTGENIMDGDTENDN